PLEVAAGSMLQGMTAHYLVHGTRETRPGDVALVHAAAGGVGLLLVQMLKAAGARVIGTCSTAEKEALAREAGADDVVRSPERAPLRPGRGGVGAGAGAVLGAVAAGRLRVRIGARFPLAEAAAAHRALEGRATAGKVLLLPG